MPRPAKGARLWLRPERREGAKLVARSTWIILDRGKQHPTGCAAGEIEGAEAKLAAYIAAKHQPARKVRDIEEISIADVLSIYLDDCSPPEEDAAEKLAERIGRLNEFWGGRMLAEVTGETCRAYVAHRGKRGGARRDLEDLRAAINHHAKEGFHRGTVRVVLPEKGAPRDRWLTRDEAARLIWAAWRCKEKQTRHRGPDKGKELDTKKRPLRHVARFILIALYTGTRAGAVATASPIQDEGRSFVDLDNGIFYRLATGRRATKKRQPPVPIPPRLLAHLRRWHEKGIAKEHFVEWRGKPVASVKTGFATAVGLAKLPGRITPHTLRHTAATWLMQLGVDKWQAAGFLGMSVEMLDRVYGHHHPDHMKGAANAIGFRPRKPKPEAETLVISLEEEREKRAAAG